MIFKQLMPCCLLLRTIRGLGCLLTKTFLMVTWLQILSFPVAQEHGFFDKILDSLFFPFC